MPQPGVSAARANRPLTTFNGVLVSSACICGSGAAKRKACEHEKVCLRSMVLTPRSERGKAQASWVGPTSERRHPPKRRQWTILSRAIRDNKSVPSPAGLLASDAMLHRDSRCSHRLPVACLGAFFFLGKRMTKHFRSHPHVATSTWHSPRPLRCPGPPPARRVEHLNIPLSNIKQRHHVTVGTAVR